MHFHGWESRFRNEWMCLCSHRKGCFLWPQSSIVWKIDFVSAVNLFLRWHFKVNLAWYLCLTEAALAPRPFILLTTYCWKGLPSYLSPKSESNTTQIPEFWPNSGIWRSSLNYNHDFNVTLPDTIKCYLEFVSDFSFSFHHRSTTCSHPILQIFIMT